MPLKKKLKTIVVEVNREKEIGQTLWLLLNNQKTQVRMGVIYGPQENVTPNSELRKLYESISDQADIGKENNQQIMILGDFNEKTRNYINYHKGRKSLEKIGGKTKAAHGEWRIQQM